MKKFLTIALLACLIITASFFLLSCDTGNDADDSAGSDPSNNSSPENNPPQDDTPSSGETDTPKQITGVSFADQSYPYDGSIKELLVTGIPTGVSVSYANNTGKDVGTYNATAVLSGEGYQTLTLTATLTITKVNMSGISFDSKSFSYNGNKQTISATGNIPEGATITYSGGEDSKNSATNIGSYTITVTITHKNYNTYTKTATLTINSSEPETPKQITGVSFSSKSYSYDGSIKELLVTGIPTGVSVSYTNNTGKDVGTYNATAVLSGEGYQTLTLTATLTITKANMSGISFDSKSFSYNGNKQTISATGNIPEGATITYSGGEDSKNSATNVGSYTITVTITHKNYNTYTKAATLTITKANMSGISFENKSFPYDTSEHTITVTGLIPGDAVITYSGGENGKNGASNVGSYTISVTITHKNYNTYNGTATLTITSAEESLSVAFSNGKIYFQNSLDNKHLYTYVSSAPSKLSKDTPKSMITVGDRLFYISNSLFSSGLYIFDPNNNSSTCVFEAKSVDSIISDGTYIYYNINKTLDINDETGIYRIKISDLDNKDAEIIPTKLTNIKTGDMTVNEGYIYFSNKSDGGKLYAISTSANNATPQKIYDYKVYDLISDEEKIYFVRDITLSNFTLGAAIYSINVNGGLNTLLDDESSKINKITASKGKYLTIIGDYIYFLNTDMVTSTISGDGIYRAKKDGSGWVGDILTNLVGASKVVDGANDKIFGLATDGTKLYYYRANTRHIYSYNISNQIENDLMAGFVPPVSTTIITSYYEKAVEYNGEIFYINMNDGGKLYKYTVATGLDVRVTNLSVADLAINDGVLYYSTVRLLVNYDLYRLNLATGDMERISTEKCKNFSFHNGMMYYTNFSGANTLNRMDLSTLEVTELFGKDVVSKGKDVDDGLTVVYNGYVYFVADSTLYRYSINDGTASVVNKDLKPLEYIIHNDKILMMNTAGIKNSITVYDISTDTVSKYESLGISGVSDDIRGMFVYNGDIYFYRNVALGSNNKGLYKLTYSNDSYSSVLVDNMEGYYMCESIVIGNKVYFLDVWQVKDTLPTTSSTAKLCVYDMNTKTVTKLN